MQNMFRNANNFNGDISNWNVRNVKNMFGMFSGTTNFNTGINIVLWNLKLGNSYNKDKFIKYLFDKLKRSVFVFGRSCIYLNIIYEEIHFRPEGLGFKKCLEEFNKLSLDKTNS